MNPLDFGLRFNWSLSIHPIVSQFYINLFLFLQKLLDNKMAEFKVILLCTWSKDGFISYVKDKDKLKKITKASNNDEVESMDEDQKLFFVYNFYFFKHYNINFKICCIYMIPLFNINIKIYI